MKTFATVAVALVTWWCSLRPSGGGGTASDADQPFWADPCGYGTTVDDDEGGPAATIDRILTLAEQCQSNVDRFKRDYVGRTFGADYDAHYGRWKHEANGWMTPRLLDTAEDDLPQSWLDGRAFPGELTATFDVLQRAAVGFELLTNDAADAQTAENAFADRFDACRVDLRQLLCEVADDIDANGADADKPPAIGRDAIPDDVRRNASTAGRNLTNSIIFRDYMIAVKYVAGVYRHFKSRLNADRPHGRRRRRPRPSQDRLSTGVPVPVTE